MCTMSTHGLRLMVLFQEGANFFEGWVFQAGPDATTSGTVTYVDQDTAVCSAPYYDNTVTHGSIRIQPV